MFSSYFVNPNGNGATVELILSLLSFLAHLIFKRRSLWSNLSPQKQPYLYIDIITLISNDSNTKESDTKHKYRKKIIEKHVNDERS